MQKGFVHCDPYAAFKAGKGVCSLPPHKEKIKLINSVLALILVTTVVTCFQLNFKIILFSISQ